MRIAVLSDVHANLDALEVVLARARDEGVDATYVLGDIVGYGAEPQEVVDRLAGLPGVRLIAGNHDLAATQRFDLDWFNHEAAAAIRWTVGRLSEEGRGLLSKLEPRGDEDDTVLVHGSVRDPASEYLVDRFGARASFEHEPFGLCFFGHTHVPSIFQRNESGKIKAWTAGDGERLSLSEDGRYLVNPGSVGQPRDNDPRASFLVFDTEERSAVWRRVPYPVEEAQRKIRDAGLPRFLADRLGEGL